ncbi:MAG: hypothetical protein AB8H86_27680 [Polyangiales bacterium]
MDVFQPPPLYSTLLFLGLLAICQAALVVAARRAGPEAGRGRRTLIATGVVVFVGALTAALATWVLDPEAFVLTALTLLSLNITALAIAFRPIGLGMGAAFPVGAWVLFHAFRLPLEYLLTVWHEAGTIPEQITWSGQNFDVATGILALVLGPVLLRWPNKKLALAFHIVGLALLFNVARIAVLSAPGAPIDVFDEPVLLAFHVPFIWIVPFAVVAALFAHVIALRALLRRSDEMSSSPRP